MQQDSESTGLDIIEDKGLTRKTIEIESKLFKNIDKSEKTQEETIDKLAVATPWRAPKTGIDSIDKCISWRCRIGIYVSVGFKL